MRGEVWNEDMTRQIVETGLEMSTDDETDQMEKTSAWTHRNQKKEKPDWD